MAKRGNPFKNLVLEEGFITEGSAKITAPKGVVFYNPVQQFNRDLSVSVISTFQRHYLEDPKLKKRFPNKSGVSIMEALSATGLRSIRYAKEVPNVLQIVANDLDPDAVELIKKNVLDNLGENSIINPNQANAIHALHFASSQGQNYDVIDLDPYGSASPFIDASMANIADGGLLCVTCTDTAVLCASYPESCYSKYGSIPLKGEISHEAALRILLSSLEATASRHKKFIKPLISCSIDFYIRVFITVHESPAESKLSCTRSSLVLRCVGCKSFQTVPLMSVQRSGRSQKFSNARLESDNLCSFCQSRKEIAGPIWNGPIHDPAFIDSVLNLLKEESFTQYFGTLDRMLGTLSVCKEELPDPLYMSLNEAAHIMKTSCPPLLTFRSAYLNSGHKVSLSHCNPRAIKSDAPIEFFWKVFAKWITESAIDNSKLSVTGQKIYAFAVGQSEEIKLERHPDANPPSRQSGLSRFPENPLPNWGPLARAKTQKID